MKSASPKRRSRSTLAAPRRGERVGVEPGSVLVLTREPGGLPRWLSADRDLAVQTVASVAEARHVLHVSPPEVLVLGHSLGAQERAGILDEADGIEIDVVFLASGAPARGARPLGRVVAGHPPAQLARVPVRRGDEIMLLPVREVASFEADGDLVYVTTVRGERHTVTRPLKALEARLHAASFVRLSRSVVVNVNAITRLRLLARGALSVVLINQAEFVISRSHSAAVRRRLVDL